MTINFNSWEAKFVLEALRTLDAKWTDTIDSTDDEDIQSEYGNDLAQLQLVQQRVETAACQEFGPKVKEFSREPVGAARSCGTPTNLLAT